MKTYLLKILVEKPIKIKIGKLGTFKFCGGYIYVGSGKRNLSARVRHHFQTARQGRKKKHWHIDYLLSNPYVKIMDVEYSEKEECEVSKKLARKFAPVRGFGSSDCGCEGHLFKSENLNNE